ncbi:MAG: hypothetical protein OHK0022_39980 [Roseiflexaceae bacterium]
MQHLATTILSPERRTLNRLTLPDLPADEALNRLTRMATQLLHAPIALVSLVEADRLILLSCAGLTGPWASARQAPLGHTLCRFVMANELPLVLNDARTHPLLHDLLAVREMGFVAYVGVPLHATDGLPIGTFCVADQTPRRWTDEEVGILHDLAALTMTELALRNELVEHQRSEAALRVRYRKMVEHLAQGLMIVDRRGLVRYANPRLSEMLGRPLEALIGRPASEWCGQAHVWTTPEWLALGAPDNCSGVELRLERPDDTELWVAITATPLYDEEGRVVGTQTLFTDITESRRAQQALRASESKLRLVLEQLPLCIWTTDTQLRLTSVAGAGFEQLGLDTALITGYTLAEIFQGSELANGPIEAHTRALSGQLATYELTLGDHTFEVSVAPFRDAQDTIVGCLAAALDISELRGLWSQIKESRERLQWLSLQLLRAQELERHAIARELHDEIGQSLTAAHLNLQAALGAPNRRSQALYLEDCLGLVEQLLTQVRTLSLDLRPSLLDDAGLVAALRWYVQRQAARAGFEACVLADDEQTRLPAEIETACFRIVQEALTNVVRHARASYVQVELHWTPDLLFLSVADNGIGFDVATGRNNARSGGSLGLLGMEERAQLLGGSLTIESTPGAGTRLHAQLPLGEVSR